MTNREFLTAVAQNETLSAEIRKHATDMLAKADEKNAKRRETPNKTQLANEPIKAQILELLADKPMVASDIAKELEITTQKASALARQLVECGQLSVADVKVKGKGSVKCYSLAKDE
jgi:predicted Rossmann fold nucleotide-binding protein DprA/Smf involved in DNA uptake